MLNAGLAVLLVGVSLCIAGTLAGLVLRAFPFRLSPASLRLRRYVYRARRGDRYLGAGSTARAVAEFRAAFCPYTAGTRALADAIRRHHTGLLSRLLAAADQAQGGAVRLMSLARADRLFRERTRLQEEYLAAPREGGRDARRAIRIRLAANTGELHATLDWLVEEILGASGPQQVQ